TRQRRGPRRPIVGAHPSLRTAKGGAPSSTWIGGCGLVLAVGVGLVEGLEELLGADDLAVESAGNQGVALDEALLCAGDGDAVDFEGAAEGALVIGLGFGEIGQGAEFSALSGDEIALGENNVINGGGAEFVFFALGVESLLLELASLAGGLHLSAALLDGDGGVANIEEGVVLDLLGLRFHLALDELRVDVVGLGGTVAERKSQSELGGVSWEIIVEDLRLRGAQAVLGDASDGRGDLGNVKTSDRSTASIDDLLLQV